MPGTFSALLSVADELRNLSIPLHEWYKDMSRFSVALCAGRRLDSAGIADP